MFSQPNLVPYLREIERSLTLEKFSHPSSLYQNHWNSTVASQSMREASLLHTSSLNESWSFDKSNPDQSFQLSFVNRWNMIIKQKIYELEGTTFFYQYLFAVPPSKDVSRENLSFHFFMILKLIGF